jgi:DNA-binding beta-propeller fold protein YncE
MVLITLIVLFLSVLRFSLICIGATVVMHYPSRLISYWVPTDIAVSPTNQHLFIADMSFNRILHLSPEAIYLSTINLPIDQSMSYSPVKLAIDLAGYLYVATGASNSFAIIYKYRTTDDQLVERIPLSVYVPAALTISPINGDIYVATTDTNDTSVHILDKSGRQINKFNASNFSPPLTQPTALTMDGTAQRLYVANRDDSTTGRVFVVNPQTGKQLQFYINNNIYRPTAVTVDVYLNIYVADMATNCIVALTSNGTLIRTYTHSLYSPQGLTFSANGNLLLSDTLNSQLVLFDLTTAKVLQVYSSSDPALISPRLIVLLNSGDIYVNSLNNDIQYNILKKLTITNSSANVTQIIDPKPHFGFPVGLALDMQGQMYVTDADIPYGCIHIFASNGTEIGRISTTNPPLRNPHGIATDLQGNIYVADSGNSRVIKLLINGTIVQSYTTTPPLQYAYDVKVRDDGVLYISDGQCACIYRLTNDGKQLAVIQLQGQSDLINPFLTLFPSATSSNPDLLITIDYPSPQVNQYTPNGTLVASYTIPPSASTSWNPYVSVIDEKRRWLIVAESGGRLMFFDL